MLVPVLLTRDCCKVYALPNNQLCHYIPLATSTIHSLNHLVARYLPGTRDSR